MSLGLLSADMLEDRVDILTAHQFVEGQAVRSTRETPRLKNVRCLIVSSSGNRLATLLGIQVTSTLVCIMEGHIDIRENDAVVSRFGDKRYVVKQKSPYPNDIRRVFWVLDLSEDLSVTR